MDDILVHGKTEQEHDQNLISVLGRIQSAGVTLNEENCLFEKKKIRSSFWDKSLMRMHAWHCFRS